MSLETLRKKLQDRRYAWKEVTILGETFTATFRRISPVKYMELYGSIFAQVTPQEASDRVRGQDPDSIARNVRLAIETVLFCLIKGGEPGGAIDDSPLFSREELELLDLDDLNTLADLCNEVSGLNKEVAEEQERFQEAT